MSMTIKYICIQFCSFAVATVIASLGLGIGLTALLLGLAVSVLVVGATAWYDNSVGCLAQRVENLFAELTDEQLRECYEAYFTLEEGKTSNSMLFFKLLTRYEDAADNGYEKAADDLTSEITKRWTNFENEPMLAG